MSQAFHYLSQFEIFVNEKMYATDYIYRRENPSNVISDIKRICGSHVIVVDDLGIGLHTLNTLDVIRRFYASKNRHSSQLIAATHDTNILDLDLLRQDEIWLIEKTDDISSFLKPLSSYKPCPDNGRNLRQDYLIGRYGAVPIFDSCII